jgi:predicted TPR repeat methyltransferase
VSQFELHYSQLYDAIHANKNYEDDVRKILTLMSEFKNSRDSTSLLDFGCGTGKHLSIFRSLKFDVQGYDLSEEMLSIASQNNPEIFFSSDLNTLRAENDLVVSLFDVLSYQTNPQMLETYLQQVFSKVSKNGFALFDFWNLSGVRLSPPEDRTRTFKFNDKSYLRSVCAESSEDFRMTSLSISLRETDSEEVIYSQEHAMRAYDLDEIKGFLPRNASVLAYRDSSDYRLPVTTKTWRSVLLLQRN